MEIRRAGLLWNGTKDAGLRTASQLAEILQARGVEICTPQRELVTQPGISRQIVSDSFDGCQVLFVLGGDGTLLSALDQSLARDIPMLGINLGRMGFLAEVEPDRLREDMDALFRGDYRIDTRMTMRTDALDEQDYFALNEIIITRSDTSYRMISVEIEADGTLVDRISGDGIIVASATGSTAYSLSAGGPIVSPGLDCFVLTPICPHTMNARPVVLKSDARITIRILDGGEAGRIVFDGKRAAELPVGEPGVTIMKSRRQAKFIRLHDRNYFSLLRGKLSEWTH